MPARLLRIRPLPMLFAVGVVFATVSRAQDAARLAPADTSTYIQLSGLSDVRAAMEADPLFQPLFDPRSDVGRYGDAAWAHLEDKLGLTRREIFDRYFGRKVAAVFSPLQPDGPPVILSAVSREDAAAGVTRLGLEKETDLGPFAVYKTADGGGRIGLGDGWMALGPASDAAFMDRVLESIAAGGPTLADDPAFRKWTGKLPSGGSLFLFSRDPASSQHHALAISLNERDWTLEYAGGSPPLRAALAAMGDAAALDFGPLPETTLAAATLNLYSPRVDPRLAERVDRLLAPKTLANDIVPKLAAPIVVGLGEVAVHEVDPAVGTPVPAAAIALKMRDPSVAADLDRLFGSIVTAANVVAAAGRFEPIPLTVVGGGDEAYHVVDLGGPLSRRLSVPRYAGLLRIAYGRVGDWYVVTTHEAYFRRCRETQADPTRLFSASEDVRLLATGTPAEPLAAVVIRSPRLGAHLASLLSHLKEAQPAVADLGQVRGLEHLGEVLSAYHGVSIQAHRDEPESVRATIRLVRTSSPGAARGVSGQRSPTP